MAYIPGTEDIDVLFGTDDDDQIFGFGGNDALIGFTAMTCSTAAMATTN